MAKVRQEILEQKTLKEEVALLQTFDAATTKMLGEPCCSVQGTGQFLYFVQSRACTTNICEVPGKDAGWDMDKFLQYYIRTLHEVIERAHEIGEGHFFTTQERFLLLKEQQLAISCRNTALLGKALEEANHRVSIARNEFNECLLRYRQMTSDLEASNKKTASACEGLRAARERARNYSRSKEYRENLADWMTYHKSIVGNHQAIYDQISVLRTELNAKRQALLLAKQAHNMVCEEYAETLFEKVLALTEYRPNSYDYHCQAVGSEQHAMYINFRKFRDRIEARIYNVGAGSKTYHTSPENSELILPVTLRFKQNEEERQRLKQFCLRIAKAFTQPEAQAFRLLYQDIPNMKALQRYSRWLHTLGNLAGEIAQTTSNCTSKGFFHSLRNRLLESPGTYEKLVIAIFVCSKNTHALRQSLGNIPLPANFQALFTNNDLLNLIQSQEAFKNKPTKELMETIIENFGFIFPSSNVVPRALTTHIPRATAPSILSIPAAAAGTAAEATCLWMRSNMQRTATQQSRSRNHTERGVTLSL